MGLYRDYLQVLIRLSYTFTWIFTISSFSTKKSSLDRSSSSFSTKKSSLDRSSSSFSTKKSSMDYSKFSWENLAQLNKNLQCQISVLKEERRSSDTMRDLLEGQVQILTETHHHSMVSQQKGITNGILMSNLVEKSNKRGLDEQKIEQALKKWQESFQLNSLIFSAKPAKKPLRVFKSGSRLFVLRPDLLDVLSP